MRDFTTVFFNVMLCFSGLWALALVLTYSKNRPSPSFELFWNRSFFGLSIKFEKGTKFLFKVYFKTFWSLWIFGWILTRAFFSRSTDIANFFTLNFYGTWMFGSIRRPTVLLFRNFFADFISQRYWTALKVSGLSWTFN